MKRILRLPFWTALLTPLFLLIAMPASAQEGRAPLFASHDVLQVRIEGPLKTLQKQRPDEEYLDGTFTVLGADGGEMDFDLKFRTRGRYRRQKSTCRFPPVRLNFRKGQVEETLLAGQDKLKLVTHCQRSDRYEQLVLREYLTYRMLQSLTDKSFSARLLRITWVDSEGDDPIEKFGFVIEDDDDIGDRIGFEKLEVPKISAGDLDPTHTNLINVFEYMIGNTDFSTIAGPADDDCCHNTVPFQSDGKVYPIPYDFDFSGMVDAPYAEPNPRFKIRSVKTRVYRGRCTNNEAISGSVAQLIEQKGTLMDLVSGLDGLDRRSRQGMTRFLNQFFAIIEDPRDVEKELAGECI